VKVHQVDEQERPAELVLGEDFVVSAPDGVIKFSSNFNAVCFTVLASIILIDPFSFPFFKTPIITVPVYNQNLCANCSLCNLNFSNVRKKKDYRFGRFLVRPV
jgi:hypothetical protein